MSVSLTIPPLAETGTDALAALSSALRVPVQIVAIALLVILVYEIGRILAEVWRRVRPGAVQLQTVALDALRVPTDADRIARRAPGPLAERAILALARASGGRAAGAGGDDAGAGADGAAGARVGTPGGRGSGREDFEPALAAYELGVQRRLDRTRMLVRAGPAFGLMGTLIPLAPGLGGLAKGDYAVLANALRVAFAATVAGLLVGTVAFALTLWRTRLYTEDLVALERAIELYDPAAPVPALVAQTVGEHEA